MENEKLNIASLLGASNLLKQLLEEKVLTHEEADTVMRKLVKDNGFSETDVSWLINRIHGENYYLRDIGKGKRKS